MRRFLERRSRKPQDLTRYFTHGITAWVLEMDDDARFAALTAAILAEDHQQQAMLQYLNAPELPEEELTPEIVDELNMLAKEISAADTSVRSILKQRRKLADLDPQYANALDNNDAGVFARRHPHLFLDA